MGKKQHQKDKMYISPTEWKYEWGGKIDGPEKRIFKKLPFDRCSISFQPFVTPVCSLDGIVFELTNIIPYLKKHGKNPVTGAALSKKDLITLHFHKNNETGLYHCPVTYKAFTIHSHIVAIKTSGNVFSWEAVEQLNIQAKSFQDLVSGENFTKADIITLQDPKDSTGREISKFAHVVESETDAKGKPEEKQGGSSVVQANDAMQRILNQIPGKKLVVAAGTDEKEKKRKEEEEKKKKAAAKRKPEGDDGNPNAPKKYKSHLTTYKASASFTSTQLNPMTSNEKRDMTDEEIREAWYKQFKVRNAGKKAFVTFKTNLGKINLMLHADIVPRAVHSFLTNCANKYYDNTIFHRLIPGFMIQGGDPAGTGKGGKSAWGTQLKDEFHPSLRHSERGVVSMANSGRNTNGSQFFFTFGATPHLDDKHVVFGKIVGGMEILDSMEATPTGTPEGKEYPVNPIKILETTVYVNPFDEPYVPDEELEEQKKQEQEKKEVMDAERGSWFSAPQPKDVKSAGSGIGKYITSLPAPKGSSSSSSNSGKSGLSLPPPSTVDSKPSSGRPSSKPKSTGFDAFGSGGFSSLASSNNNSNNSSSSGSTTSGHTTPMLSSSFSSNNSSSTSVPSSTGGFASYRDAFRQARKPMKD